MSFVESAVAPGSIVRTDGYINNLGAERIEQECDALIQEGYRKLVINFEKSPIINSMGLSILIGIIEKILEIRGVLAFTDLTPVNAETMEIMGLTEYARIFHTEGLVGARQTNKVSQAAAKRAGTRPVHFHLLRHTTASLLVAEGAPDHSSAGAASASSQVYSLGIAAPFSKAGDLSVRGMI